MKGRLKLANVLAEVLADATLAANRSTAEAAAVKTAASAPRTELAIGLRALADQVRTATADLTYGDLS